LQEAIDEEYTRTPFYGVARMTAHLRRDGRRVNEKRVRRLMRRMGLSAIYPKPRLSVSGQGHPAYPYLLRGLTIDRPDHVWASDITYIRLRGGFVYLRAVMDCHSRYVLSWELSNTLDAGFCVEALDRAVAVSQPEIFNSDRGAQYTSEAFTGRLKKVGVKISMDGRGGIGQHLRRAVVADGELRGDVSAALRGHGRGVGRSGALLPLLQPGAAAPGFEMAHAARSVLRNAGGEGRCGVRPRCRNSGRPTGSLRCDSAPCRFHLKSRKKWS